METALQTRAEVSDKTLWTSRVLTGYLGGAVSAHMRVGNPLFEAYIFPTLVGALLWGGLLLVDARLRTLMSSGVRG